MNKSKLLFIIITLYLVVFTFFISKSIYLFFTAHIEKWNSVIDIIAIVILVVIVLPITIFIFEKLTTSILKRKLAEKKIYYTLITVLMFIPIIVFSVSMLNEYKTKSLKELLEYDKSSFEAVFVNHQKMTEDHQAVKKMVKFLSQYQVKKINDRDWNSDVSKETGFMIEIRTENEVVMASIYENQLMSINNNGDYYKVVNGPIEIRWVYDYIKGFDNF
ncbi:hypothetical protein M3E13_17975 [Oceanobacillus kimchii]|uniref:hypothetical protein n=1 Tax=Oceanobacillus kimchii TaxID=746691 RepID=UPI0021A737BE|nr:hypothetical protein [Oceanobacillus kimchii]MCT1578763.1 hypothetical protein [Oceanobacillus kimchii]MCT2137787.1 hypothetical protein [Oceanobacillus kimchii]